MEDLRQTNAPHGIERRSWQFGRDLAPRRWSHGGDAGRTAFYKALSSIFPVGKKILMSAVRHYRDDTPEPLREQIDDFIIQGSTPSREHVFFNRQARDTGYDLTSSEVGASRTIARVKRRPPIMQLAGTCALEPFIATLANAILVGPDHLSGADAEAQRIWRWHAIEEIEHKAVAYDKLLLAMRDRSPFRRWARRSFTMLAAGVRFHYVVFRNTAALLRQDRKNTLRTWAGLLSCLYGKLGLMRPLLRDLFAYFRPNFHPLQHHSRARAQRAIATLSPPFVALMPK